MKMSSRSARQNGSPSRSMARSRREGSGSRSNPRPASAGSSSVATCPFERVASCSRACSCSVASVPVFRSTGVVSTEPSASAASVETPEALSDGGLRAPDLGDVVKVVGGAPLLVASAPERAPLTGLALLGDGCGRRVDEALERALRAREVRVEVAWPERLAPAGAERDVHVLRRVTLHGRDARAVEAQLQDVRRARLVARELGVHRLVAERAERGRRCSTRSRKSAWPRQRPSSNVAW